MLTDTAQQAKLSKTSLASLNLTGRQQGHKVGHRLGSAWQSMHPGTAQPPRIGCTGIGAWRSKCKLLCATQPTQRPLHCHCLGALQQSSTACCLQKDAWTRKENCWKNEQRQRSQAEERWDLRRRIAEAESDSRFLFQKQYEEQVQKRLKAATYKPWTRSKRKAKGPADPSQEEMAPAADKPAQTPAPSTPRLNRDL